MRELIAIQSELKAPKNQRNNFNNYNYRSAEDILEAVKPILKRHNCLLTLSDRIIQVGERIYIEATATLINSEAQTVFTTACAREEDVKKGMDAAQITGSASSYARKYALNGLFCIDDTKDTDATNTHGKEVVREDVMEKEFADCTDRNGKEVVREDVMEKEFADCTDRNGLVDVWNKYKGTSLEEQAKTALRKRKQELGIEK